LILVLLQLLASKVECNLEIQTGDKGHIDMDMDLDLGDVHSHHDCVHEKMQAQVKEIEIS